MNRKLRAHLLLLAVNFFYGAGFSVAKLVMPQYVKPFAFILIRVAFAATMFYTLQRQLIKEEIQRKHLFTLFLCSCFGVVLNQELFFLGLERTTPINASLIMITTPMLVYVISFIAGGENISLLKIGGIVLGAFGTLMILGGKRFSFSSQTLLGDIFILLNATSYAIYLVLVRPLMRVYHPLTVVSYVFLLGLPFVFVLGINQLITIQWHTFTPAVWSGLFFIVIATTFLAYLFNMIALRELGSAVVGAYIYLQPLLAGFFAFLLGQEDFSSSKIAAAVLIFVGVGLVSLDFSEKKSLTQ
ncbi:MAG: DMT family transporter [Chitinophagales bacterium]|nr:DMT family transporter [Chitinophagales bacterium]MDW8272701.1 DMT family transporter [Chitinophagales bacterium]